MGTSASPRWQETIIKRGEGSTHRDSSYNRRVFPKPASPNTSAVPPRVYKRCKVSNSAWRPTNRTAYSSAFSQAGFVSFSAGVLLVFTFWRNSASTWSKPSSSSGRRLETKSQCDCTSAYRSRRRSHSRSRRCSPMFTGSATRLCLT